MPCTFSASVFQYSTLDISPGVWKSSSFSFSQKRGVSHLNFVLDVIVSYIVFKNEMRFLVGALVITQNARL